MRTPRERVYTVAVTFTVGTWTDAHLRSQRAVRAEVRSWLESLNATVREVRVTTTKPEVGEK